MAGKLETRVERVEFNEDKERFQNQLERLINYWFCLGWDFKALIRSPANPSHLWVVLCRERRKEEA